jgi:intracellular multiplication protein IcmB
MSWFYKFFLPFQSAFRYSFESFVRLESADDATTIVAKDGSLVTYLRIDGSRQVIGDVEYQYLVEGSTIKIGA